MKHVQRFEGSSEKVGSVPGGLDRSTIFPEMFPGMFSGMSLLHAIFLTFSLLTLPILTDPFLTDLFLSGPANPTAASSSASAHASGAWSGWSSRPGWTLTDAEQTKEQIKEQTKEQIEQIAEQGDAQEQDGEGELYILVHPRHHELWIMLGEIPLKRYPIALGEPRTPTPVGEFRVINKYKNWGSGFGTRWIGLDIPWGTYGIHGTNRPQSIGTHASHGCIRMFNRHVEEIYEWVEIGTRVVILGHVLRGPDLDPRDLARGDAGGDVMLVQNRLKSGGYYQGLCHGRFDHATEKAVRAFERDHGLPVDGVINLHDYIALGLVE